jgi:hypothetical protein
MLSKLRRQLANFIYPERTMPEGENGYTVRFVTDPDGVEWKVFGDGKSPALLPRNRMIPAELAIILASRAIDNEELIHRTDQCIELFNKGQIGAIASVLHETKARLSMCAPLKSWLELACVYVMFPDEKPNEYVPAIQQRKIEYWQNHPASGFFFANLVRHCIPSMSNISDGDFQTYLKMMEIAKKTTDEYVTAQLLTNK